MVTILVADSKDGSGFSCALSRILRRHFNEEELRLCDIKNAQSTGDDNMIVVYKQLQPTAFRPQGDQTAVAIVDSSDEQLLRHVSDTRLPAITCGLRSRDTITLSSMAGESVVIDLRRSISCLNGDTAEPQEIPLRQLDPHENFLLMASAAILILSGKIECLKEGYI
ncbi:MAG: hypothetical protein FWE19_04000 [Oscillospiraceae bacterium]|nr:hypothetical protein [Oscillospiraceae bacterium]